MFTSRNLQKHYSLRTLSFLLQSNPNRFVVGFKDATPALASSNVMKLDGYCEENFASFSSLPNPSNGWYRMMSTPRGRSMRSKVESRMQKESGKTAREIRRAKKIKKKLMTDEERLIYNLKRAKKKVALLLQKLKKYELPELPPSVHDPELLTPEQLQAYKKIGFRNKNYVPVGVRGVFGGVVQNMHMHWKFHETVQVCCDNFPKEKIKEMATMIARLSGGIAINIHNVKTIIMFRGRNYRQPKNLIPINTLTKRKALFKARFEQALEAQKLNIKKIEQELRRKGISPEDPVAMASIQRVASTFFNAIDEKEGSPYVFRDDQSPLAEPTTMADAEASAESDQEELDRFIAEIEDAADKEWAEGEEEEKEEIGRIRYWNRKEFEGRPRRLDTFRNDYSDNEVRGSRGWKDTRGNKRSADSGDEYEDNFGGAADHGNAGDVSGAESDDDNDDDEVFEFKRSRAGEGKLDKIGRWNNTAASRKKTGGSYRQPMAEDDSEMESLLCDLDNAMRESDAEEDHDIRASNSSQNFGGAADHGNAGDVSEAESDDDNDDDEVFEFKRSRAGEGKLDKIGRWNNTAASRKKTGGSCRQPMAEEDSEMESLLSDLDNELRESDAEEDHDIRASNSSQNFRSSSDEEDGFYSTKGNEKNRVQYYESDDSYEDHDELDMSNTKDRRRDGIARGSSTVGLKRDTDADFGKKIPKEAEDVFSD